MSDRGVSFHASGPGVGTAAPAQRTPRNSLLQQIATELETNRSEIAEKKLSEYLGQNPQDTNAIMLMARALDRRGKTADAVSQLSRCLELDAGLAAARFVRGRLLFRLHRYREALADERNPGYRELKADILANIGQEQQAREICQQLVAENPRRAEWWVLYGASLRSTGAYEESIAAYRRAIECRHSYGWAWWSLADIKGFRFGDADLAAMQELLTQPGVMSDDRMHLLFALGKAFEDQGDYQRAFEYYEKANGASGHRSGENSTRSPVSRIKAVFSAEFMRNREGSGCKIPAPIFVLGRPRSGSTLVEQILASHSAVEGTGELPYVADLVRQLCESECRTLGTRFPDVLEKLDNDCMRALGESYLESAAIHRKERRPYFVDKMPTNYLHVGMLHLILPNAKIVDVRRNPAATCVSMFRHNLGKSNVSLEELARLYRGYVELMAHFDRVLPGRIHRVIYEDLVADPEAETRKILQYLGLQFEESCLRYYATDRAIRTPSSEQVRRPIFGHAVDHWRNFEPWLVPLTQNLGTVLSSYPSVPSELC